MPRKPRPLSDAAEHVPTNAHWVISWAIKVNGRDVEPGTEVKISGEPGRFAFRRHVLNPANGAEWIDVFGGPVGGAQIRSFRPDRVATVHRLKKARASK